MYLENSQEGSRLYMQTLSWPVLEVLVLERLYNKSKIEYDLFIKVMKELYERMQWTIYNMNALSKNNFNLTFSYYWEFVRIQNKDTNNTYSSN